MLDNITPQAAIKLAERHPTFSPKERQKMLALALAQVSRNEAELALLWDISVKLAQVAGHQIPAYDPAFVLAINETPSAYQDYK